MKKVLGIDVGGTKITYSIINEKGEIISDIKRESTPKKREELEELFKKIIKEKEKEVDYIAIATAGSVDKDNTKVGSATHNMPEGYHLTEFSKLSKKRVYVENDANAAAWAEYKIGAGIGENNTIIITIGTGIGGGFIVDGKIVRGKTGKGGEVGSIKIKDRNRICSCGRKDCWESYASGTGLKITAEEVANTDKIFERSCYRDKNPKEISTYDIIKGIKERDEYSEKVFNIWKSDIIKGLISITNIFDEESIIISGGMGEFIDIKEIEEAVNKEIVVSPIKVKQAKAGNYAGMIGASLLACEKYRNE